MGLRNGVHKYKGSFKLAGLYLDKSTSQMYFSDKIMVFSGNFPIIRGCLRGGFMVGCLLLVTKGRKDWRLREPLNNVSMGFGV